MNAWRRIFPRPWRLYSEAVAVVSSILPMFLSEDIAVSLHLNCGMYICGLLRCSWETFLKIRAGSASAWRLANVCS